MWSGVVSIRPSRTSLDAPKQTGSKIAGDHAYCQWIDGPPRVTARAERMVFDTLIVLKAH